MKYFFGFCVSTLVAILFNVLNIYILKMQIPDFLCGWMIGMCFFISVEYYDYKDYTE